MSRPDDPSACDVEAKVCEYLEILENPTDVDCDEITYSFRCESGSWVEYAYHCTCPDLVPEDGADCLGFQATITGCVYPATAACGETEAEAVCHASTDFAWRVIVDEECMGP